MILVWKIACTGEMRNQFKILSENLKGRNHREDLDVSRRVMLLEWILEIGWKIVDLIYLAQDRDQWWAHVDTVTNHRVR